MPRPMKAHKCSVSLRYKVVILPKLDGLFFIVTAVKMKGPNKSLIIIIIIKEILCRTFSEIVSGLVFYLEPRTY